MFDRPQESEQGLDVLFAELQPQLVRILSRNLQASDWVIEDACQVAWGALVAHRAAVSPGSELGWLSTTATRTALGLLRRERRVRSTEDLPEPTRLADFRSSSAPPGPEDALALRERLAEIRRLPVRQQRMLLLHGFGYDYEEIAAVTGDTRRTVTRQLDRARQRLMRMAEEG